MSEFRHAGEFTCPGCGEPMSLLPADHEVALDDSGATICSSGVRPVKLHVKIWGTDKAWGTGGAGGSSAVDVEALRAGNGGPTWAERHNHLQAEPCGMTCPGNPAKPRLLEAAQAPARVVADGDHRR